MGKGEYKSINGVYKKIKNDIDCTDKDNNNNINIITLYANNGIGKTRLSKYFQESFSNQTLCYNAFFEDFFSWDNDNCLLKVYKNSWVLDLISEHGLNGKIIDNFKVFTGTKIEPDIDNATGNIVFRIPGNNRSNQNEIKISRGEESIFIWSVFYTVLETVIEILNENEEDRATDIFNNIKYVIIDDPVS